MHNDWTLDSNYWYSNFNLPPLFCWKKFLLLLLMCPRCFKVPLQGPYWSEGPSGKKSYKLYTIINFFIKMTNVTRSWSYESFTFVICTPLKSEKNYALQCLNFIYLERFGDCLIDAFLVFVLYGLIKSN